MSLKDIATLAFLRKAFENANSAVKTGVGIAAVGALAFGGYKGYQWYRNRKSAAAQAQIPVSTEY